MDTFFGPFGSLPRGGPERSSKGGVKTGNKGRRPGAEQKQRMIGMHVDSSLLFESSVKKTKHCQFDSPFRNTYI